jgi:hypothetical protein
VGEKLTLVDRLTYLVKARESTGSYRVVGSRPRLIDNEYVLEVDGVKIQVLVKKRGSRLYVYWRPLSSTGGWRMVQVYCP